MSDAERKQISFGYLVSKDDFEKSPFIPSDSKIHLKKSPFYLLISIPGEEILKISVFPCENSAIKKILIRLKEFSPDLVKGISDVLKNFNLGDSTIHTTGLCFSGVRCFYETYIDSAKMGVKNVSAEQIRAEFLKVPRIEEVQLQDVTLKKM
jgi:hypothetical protein